MVQFYPSSWYTTMEPSNKDELIAQFREEMYEEIEEAIEHHEFKMTQIGIMTLVAFLGILALSLKF
ncbi:hypothetical protein L5220_04670 [Synechococcus sp. PCC 6716]|nr:hypothetical protein [Synechococcus sp. PCC 6716]